MPDTTVKLVTREPYPNVRDPVALMGIVLPLVSIEVNGAQRKLPEILEELSDQIGAESAEIQKRPDGTIPLWAVAGRTTAGALGALLRLTPQGDWLMRRLRTARIERRFGGLVDGFFGPRGEHILWLNGRLEACTRVLRLPRAHPLTIAGLFGPRGERLATLNAAHDWCVRRLRLPRVHAFAPGGIFGPRGERLLWLNGRLEACARAMRVAGARAPMSVVAGRIIAAQAHLPLVEFLRSGRARLALDPASYVEARRAATRPPEDAIALGAVGQISDVQVIPRTAGRTMTYRSNADGPSAPYVLRRDLAAMGAHVLMPGPAIEAQISYGQSWRSFMYDMSALPFIGWEPRRALTFAGIDAGNALFQVPTQGSIYGVDPIVTLYGCGQTTQLGIGTVAAMSRQRLRSRGLIHASAILDLNPSFPGYRWDQLRPGTDPWTQGLRMQGKAADVAAAYGAGLRYRAVGWTHGAPSDGAVDGSGAVIDYYAALTEMVASFDALQIGAGGQPLHFFTDQTAPVSEQTQAQGAILAQAAFALANTNRVHLIGPRYPYAFQDNIHHTSLATALIGDLEGYVKFVVLDLGQAWTPARPTAITVSGSTVTIQVARPYGMGDLAIDTDSIEAAPQNGFHVRVSGSEIAVSTVAVAADTITLTLASAIASGASVEVSNAFYGPGSTAGQHSGVWGNVKRIGPPSALLAGYTIDTWLTVFRQSVAAS
jgi:Putative flagellar system-associated repeat